VILMGLVAAASGVEDVAGFSLMQRRTSDEVRGRVVSTFSTMGLAANAIAFAIAGTIVDTFGPRSVYLLGGIVSALCIPFLVAMARSRTGGPLMTSPEVESGG
jgi:MFS family permease